MGEGDEQVHSFADDAVFGIVKEEVAKLNGEALKALRVLGKERAHVDRGQRLLVGQERLPGGCGGETGHGARLSGNGELRIANGEWRAIQSFELATYFTSNRGVAHDKREGVRIRQGSFGGPFPHKLSEKSDLEPRMARKPRMVQG